MTPAQLAAQTRATTIYAEVADLLEDADRKSKYPGIDGVLARHARKVLIELQVELNSKIRFHVMPERVGQ